MAIYFRPTGLNESETYLATLCQNSFLRLWSYPNMYSAPGKELTDLLVVCGKYVFIFSDKNCEFDDTGDIIIKWKRWWKKSIHKSKYQVLSAEKHLFYYKKPIFADPKCQEPFPIDIPEISEAKIIRITITKGCVDACQKFFGKHVGGMVIVTEHQSIDNLEEIGPFCIGDINHEGDFIHVLDEYSLKVIFDEFDTVTDFANYFIKREQFLRSTKNIVCGSELALFQRYIFNFDEDGVHDFLLPEEKEFIATNLVENIVIDDTDSWSYKLDPIYLTKKAHDAPSKIWDTLIEHFASHIIDGTMLSENLETISDHEKVIRLMALETRFRRRLLGNTLYDCQNLKDTIKRNHTRMVYHPDRPNETPYIIVHTKQREGMSDEDYRRFRSACLSDYCIVFLAENYPLFNRVVGLGFNYNNQPMAGNSEEIIVMETNDSIIDEMRKDAEEIKKELGIFNKKTMKITYSEEKEYPDINEEELAQGWIRTPQR